MSCARASFIYYAILLFKNKNPHSSRKQDSHIKPPLLHPNRVINPQHGHPRPKQLDFFFPIFFSTRIHSHPKNFKSAMAVIGTMYTQTQLLQRCKLRQLANNLVLNALARQLVVPTLFVLFSFSLSLSPSSLSSSSSTTIYATSSLPSPFTPSNFETFVPGSLDLLN